MGPPAPFLDDDFQAMEAFPLKRRWTDFRYNVLPPEALAAILPFSPQRAKELDAWSSAFLDLSKAPGKLVLSGGALACVQRMGTSAEDAPVSYCLTQRGVHGNPWVIVSWTEDWAVLTQWRVFAQYWDDFCYPMSDDIVIWPPPRSGHCCISTKRN